METKQVRMMNRVELIGYIGQMPEPRVLSNGTPVLRLGLATGESYKNSAGDWVRTTTWHNITAWGKMAEQIAASIRKGMMVAVTGKLVNRKYTDKQGQERSLTEITAIEVKAVETPEAENAADAQ
jgi:single-strand DNA-binding protein